MNTKQAEHSAWTPEGLKRLHDDMRMDELLYTNGYRCVGATDAGETLWRRKRAPALTRTEAIHQLTNH